MPSKSKIDPAKLKRKKPDDEGGGEAKEEEDVKVSSPIDKVVDYAFNPSREKIREVTIIDRIQGRLFPLLDMINMGREYILEVALYRQDAEAYVKKYERPKPIPPNLLDEFIYRTAQWQKSVAGKNLERATDIALAETEVRGADEDDPFKGGRDPFEDK